MSVSEIKNLGCFREGDFFLKSGKKSRYYIDLRGLVSYPDLIKKITGLIYSKTVDLSDYKIVGVPYGGVPYAYCLSFMYNIPSLMMRKEIKNHGTKKMIEGICKKGDKIVIIEDVLTTGKSVLESLEYLRDYKIEKIVVIVNRGEGGKELLESMGYKVEVIYNIDEFFD